MATSTAPESVRECAVVSRCVGPQRAISARAAVPLIMLPGSAATVPGMRK
ncbi:MAG: hypothetical protein WBW93_20010 [Steroidobacteraceae bacterium]